MKLIANENFQFRGLIRAGVTLTVPEALLKKEIEKGRNPNKKYGRHPWMSGLLEHCTPANDATANFITKISGEETESFAPEHDEEDDSEEILELREEFDAIGKSYDNRWKLETLRNRLVKAKKEAGAEREENARTQDLN